MAPETIGRMFGLCELQDDAGRVLDGCLAVELSQNLELLSDMTYIWNKMPMASSRKVKPESMSRYVDAEREVQAVRSGR